MGILLRSDESLSSLGIAFLVVSNQVPNVDLQQIHSPSTDGVVDPDSSPTKILGSRDRLVLNADIKEVADAIVRVVNMPFGTRPFRLHIDPPTLALKSSTA